MLLAMAGVITAAYLIYEARRMEVDLKFLFEQHLFWQSCKRRLASPDFSWLFWEQEFGSTTTWVGLGFGFRFGVWW